MGSRRSSRFGGEEEEDRGSDVDEWAGFKRTVSDLNMLNNTVPCNILYSRLLYSSSIHVHSHYHALFTYSTVHVQYTIFE